jgi:hypothetical protein
MKILVGRLAVLAAVLGVGMTAYAQARDTITRVPFGFTAAGTTLPAGDYRLSRVPGQTGAFTLRSERTGIILLAQPDAPSAGAPALVFHRYGGRHFLRTVQLAGGVRYDLPKSSAELEAAARLAQGASPETLVLPALAQ